MKIFNVIVFALIFYCAPQIIFCQTPSQVQVKFADGKIYQAKELSRTATTIKVEFLHSHSIYEFNNDGIINYSNGSYGVGSRVSYIWVYKYIQDIYEREKMRPSEEELNVGIEFDDGQVYFGWVSPFEEVGEFGIKFYHTHSYYIMQKVDGFWQVKWTDIGTYPFGTQLKRIYELAENKEIFYGSS